MKKIFISILAILSITYACKEEDFILPQPKSEVLSNGENRIFNKANPEEQFTRADGDQSINLVVELKNEAKNNISINIANRSQIESLIEKFKKFKNTKDYEILPSEYYDIAQTTLMAGAKSAELQVDIKSYETLPQGNYVLPVQLDINGNTLSHIILVSKDAEYVPLSDTQAKPLPPNRNCYEKPVKMVAYVETNDYDLRNMGQFLLKESNQPVFDMVVLFAANMNYDAATGKRKLFFNDKLKPIIENPDIYIKPLQDRGIKVIIDILPNHQGVGYENFQSYQDALDFAKEVKKATDKIGVDGWDIDEEYADYFKQPNLRSFGPTSFHWYIKAMKEVMPDKLLTLYDYGHRIGYNSVYTQEGQPDVKINDLIDYSWANYAENHGSLIGLPNEKYGKLSIEANYSFRPSQLRYSAERNLDECFGLFMIFNINGRTIKNGSATSALSAATQVFYGQDTKFVGKYHNGPKDLK